MTHWLLIVCVIYIYLDVSTMCMCFVESWQTCRVKSNYIQSAQMLRRVPWPLRGEVDGNVWTGLTWSRLFNEQWNNENLRDNKGRIMEWNSSGTWFQNIVSVSPLMEICANGIYMYLHFVCLRPAAYYVLPVFSRHPSRLWLNAAEMSVTFSGDTWALVPGCAQNSPLSFQCHPSFGALWQRALSQAFCVSWVRLVWNFTVPDGRFQRPQGKYGAADETYSPPPLHFMKIYFTNVGVKVLCLKALRLSSLENDGASTQNVLEIPLFQSNVYNIVAQISSYVISDTEEQRYVICLYCSWLNG